MSKIKKLAFMALGFTIVLSACGNQLSQNDIIATALVQTMTAMNPTGQPVAVVTSSPFFTTTPPVFIPTFTPFATRIPPTLPQKAGDTTCLKASLVGETIPDGTVMKPGAQFTKVWKIKNDSSCYWDTTYKIVFWDGDIMGGGYVYNFPQGASPGQVVDVPLVLIAPSQNGTYKSVWMLQSPDGVNFGVGQYSQPFYAQIVVSDRNNPNYGVLTVTYEIVRDPPSGCPANVFYTVYATITVNGPTEIVYMWKQQDGNNSGPKKLKFDAAGSKTLSREWSFHLGASTTHDKWMTIVILEPAYMETDKAVWQYTCG